MDTGKFLEQSVSDLKSLRFKNLDLATVKIILKAGARRRLINMKGFKFDRDGKINLSDWRLNRLENLINGQIDLLLE